MTDPIKNSKNKMLSEIDPELVKLPRSKTRIRPVTALVMVAICLTLCVRLLSDLTFSRQGESPTKIASLNDVDDDMLGQFIEIKLQPDRPSAIRMRTANATTGPVLVPTLGSQGKFWLLLHASPWNEDMRTDEVYQGRLSKLDSLHFEDAAKNYFAKKTIVPRPIALSEIRTALASASRQVHDSSGEEHKFQEETEVVVTEINTNKIRIFTVSTDPYRDEASWILALQNADILPAGAVAISSTPSSWTFDAPTTKGLTDIREKLRLAKLFAARASEIHVLQKGTWSELSLDDGDIYLGQVKPSFSTQSIAMYLPPKVATGAFVLNTTESPATYWYLPLLFGILALLGLLFAYAFYRRIR